MLCYNQLVCGVEKLLVIWITDRDLNHLTVLQFRVFANLDLSELLFAYHLGSFLEVRIPDVVNQTGLIIRRISQVNILIFLIVLKVLKLSSCWVLDEVLSPLIVSRWIVIVQNLLDVLRITRLCFFLPLLLLLLKQVRYIELRPNTSALLTLVTLLVGKCHCGSQTHRCSSTCHEVEQRVVFPLTGLLLVVLETTEWKQAGLGVERKLIIQV